MTKKLFGLAIVAALSLLALPTAQANIITSATLSASCSDFTMTFYGYAFEPGEYININWQVVALQGGIRVQENGTATLSYDGTSNPSLTITRPWTAGPVCTHITVLSPIQDGGQGSRFDWVNSLGGSGADAFGQVGSWDFDCNCSPPVTLVCRTPGFWGTHAGTEKSGSTNITLSVLNKVAGGLSICGATVSNTNIKSIQSSVEAMCVSPKGNQKLQLARQLTAAALNCVESGGAANANCGSIPFGPTFQACNSMCTNSGADTNDVQHCIDQLDCFNNGGNVLANGMCQMGSCNDSKASPCYDNSDCGLDNNGVQLICSNTATSCHNVPLPGISESGPAGSPKACNDAKGNSCTIFSCN